MDYSNLSQGAVSQRGFNNVGSGGQATGGTVHPPAEQEEPLDLSVTATRSRNRILPQPTGRANQGSALLPAASTLPIYSSPQLTHGAAPTEDVNDGMVMNRLNATRNDQPAQADSQGFLVTTVSDQRSNLERQEQARGSGYPSGDGGAALAASGRHQGNRLLPPMDFEVPLDRTTASQNINTAQPNGPTIPAGHPSLGAGDGVDALAAGVRHQGSRLATLSPAAADAGAAGPSTSGVYARRAASRGSPQNSSPTPKTEDDIGDGDASADDDSDEVEDVEEPEDVEDNITDNHEEKPIQQLLTEMDMMQRRNEGAKDRIKALQAESKDLKVKWKTAEKQSVRFCRRLKVKKRELSVAQKRQRSCQRLIAGLQTNIEIKSGLTPVQVKLDGSFACHLCSGVFQRKCYLADHLKSAHKEGKVTVACPKCHLVMSAYRGVLTTHKLYCPVPE